MFYMYLHILLTRIYAQESWSTNLKGYKYKWNIKLKWISYSKTPISFYMLDSSVWECDDVDDDTDDAKTTRRG